MLTQSQIDNFKEKLLEKKEYLEKELSKLATKDEEGKWRANFKEIARDDEMNAIEVEGFTNDAGVVDALSKDLKNIEIALEKIKAGTYGKCETCGEDINIKRLEILPEAKNCIKCKK